MKYAFVIRNEAGIHIYGTPQSYEEAYVKHYATDKIRRIMSVDADATYIGTKNIREIDDDEIIELFVSRLGYFPQKPEVK